MSEFEAIRKGLGTEHQGDPTPALEALEKIQEQLDEAKNSADITHTRSQRLSDQLEQQTIDTESYLQEIRELRALNTLLEDRNQVLQEQNESFGRALQAISFGVRAVHGFDDSKDMILNTVGLWAEDVNSVPADYADQIQKIIRRPRPRPR